MCHESMESAGDVLTPAREALQHALVSLLLEKSFARVGVKELCTRAHVARSTFYAYYGNTDDLLAEVEDEHVRAINALNAPVADPQVDEVEDMRFYAKTLIYVTGNEDDFRALLVTNPDVRFMNKWKDAIKGHLRARRRAAGRRPLSALSEEVTASAVVSAFPFMLEHPDAASPDDAYVIIAKALSALDA